MEEHKIYLDQLRNNNTFDLLSLYNSYLESENESHSDNSPFESLNNECKYYLPDEMKEFEVVHDKSTSYFHLNRQGLLSHWDNFLNLLNNIHSSFTFDFIGISELFEIFEEKQVRLPGYHPLKFRTRDDNDDNKRGVGLYIKDNIQFEVRKDLSVFIPHVIETIFIEVEIPNKKNNIIGVIYRPNTQPRASLDIFGTTLNDLLDIIDREHKSAIIMGDLNINLLNFRDHGKTNDHLDSVFAQGFIPTILKPTRVTPTSATLIDHIYTNNMTNSFTSGIVINDVADHFGVFHIEETNTAKHPAKYIQNASIMKEI